MIEGIPFDGQRIFAMVKIISQGGFMKLLCLAIVALLSPIAAVAIEPIEPIESHALAPTFHHINVVKMGANGSCEIDSDQSVDFSMPFGSDHSTLRSLKLNIYLVETVGSQDFRKIEILGTTYGRKTVTVEFVTTKTATDSLVEDWTSLPLRKWFSISEDSGCTSPIDEPFQVSDFSVRVL